MPHLARLPRALALTAVLLSGLACNVFQAGPTAPPPGPTPPAATPTTAASATRPADFTAEYYWAEATLAPPDHYEYRINVATDGTVTLHFWPDYPGPDVPEWIETVKLTPAELDALYADLYQAGLFTTHWQPDDGAPPGSSFDQLTATANGVTVTMPPHVVSDPVNDPDVLAVRMNNLFPPAVWDNLHAQRNDYYNAYLATAGAP
jgi:hypothetical protein